jgi:hypothetical protein
LVARSGLAGTAVSETQERLTAIAAASGTREARIVDSRRSPLRRPY